MISPNIINYAYPIVSLTRYKSGWKIGRISLLKRKLPPNEKGNQIKILSRKSLARLAFSVTNTDVEFRTMITLTYPKEYSTDGKEIKKHINKFFLYMMRKLGKFDYLWFLEFQKRGAPHFHVMTTLGKPSRKERLTFAQIWGKLISGNHEEYEKVLLVHSHKKAWEEIRSEHGAKGYVLKYALKPHQKIVPDEYQNVGAFWRCSKNVIPKPIIKIKATEEGVRAYLKSKGHRCAKWEVVPKFIFEQ